jgi:predicted nucleic acid-binding protein
MGRLPEVRGRDSIHAATALLYGIGTIISPIRSMASTESCALILT